MQTAKQTGRTAFGEMASGCVRMRDFGREDRPPLPVGMAAAKAAGQRSRSPTPAFSHGLLDFCFATTGDGERCAHLETRLAAALSIAANLAADLFL
jgi:hypothetical protein